MTVSRSAAPLDADGAPPPVFPMLPYAYMAYAEHYAPITDVNLLLKNYKFLGGT